MIRPFNIAIGDRKISMLLDIEPGRYYSDYALTHYLDNNQAPEPELIHVLFRALKPGDLAIDAGACVGFFAILMSRLVGPSGKVLAIEPDTRNLAMLRKNLDINECSNVEIIKEPLFSECHQVGFRQTEENGQSHLFSEAADYAEIDVLDSTTLNKVLFGRGTPTLLKMDIEGSEVDALQGLQDHRVRYIVSEINPTALARADTSPEELREWFYYRGYFPHALHESGALPSRVEVKQRLKITRENTNMLFCSTADLVALWPEVEL